MKRLLAASAILALALLGAAVSGCATSSPHAATGILAGRVTVGPLTPVERVGVTPMPDPGVFTGRQLLLYGADGHTLIEEIPIQAAGYYGVYNVTLEPGTYVLGYRYLGGVRQLPAVAVEAGKTTAFDVDIDTGIR